MTKLNDPQGFNNKYRNEKRRLDESLEKNNIVEEEHTQIQKFILHRKSTYGTKISSLYAYLSRLRHSAERTEPILVEITQHQYNAFIDKLETKYGLKDGTIGNYQEALHMFLPYVGQAWAEDIQPRDGGSSVKLEEIPSEDEIQKLMEAADNARNAAIVAVLADTGLRVGGIASIPLKYADLSSQVATLKINEEAHVKGASGRMPLTFSRPYLGNYIDVHPRNDRGDVALFHCGPGRYDEDGAGEISTGHINKILKNIADKSEVSSDKVNPHAFRHAAVTRWVREGYSERVIKHRAGWAKNSDMLEYYDHVRDEELNKYIADKEGVYDLESDKNSQTSSLAECDLCGTALHAGARYCPGCGNPQTVDAAREEAPGTLQDPQKTADELDSIPGSLDNATVATVVSRAIQKNPSILSEIDGIRWEGSEE